MQIKSGLVTRDFKSEDRPDLHAETPPLEALKSVRWIAANHKDTFFIMHIDVSRAYIHARKLRDLCWYG